MMKPKANEMPSRSAPVAAGLASTARASVATTDPGPPRTSIAVPSVSATARWPSEYDSISPPRGGLRFDIVESCSAERYASGDAPSRAACDESGGGARSDAGTRGGEQLAGDVLGRVRAGEAA